MAAVPKSPSGNLLAMNIGTHASKVSLAAMEGSFLRELETAATELGASLLS
jgi:hypothetical protein